MPTVPTTPSFADLPDQTLRDLLDLCEGRGILSPSALTNRGVPQALVKPLVYTYTSDTRDHKSTLFDTSGKQVAKLEGISDLSLARRIAQDLGAPTDQPYFGRGRNCRHLIEGALKALGARAAP